MSDEPKVMDGDWAELEREPAAIEKKKPTPVLASKAARMERLRQLEDNLLEQALTTVSDALAFRDIDPGAKEAPPNWMDLDPDEAIKRLRVANAAWMSKKEAPVGLDLSKQVAVGIIKARSTEKAAPKTINVIQVQMSAPLPQFEVLEMEDDE